MSEAIIGVVVVAALGYAIYRVLSKKKVKGSGGSTRPGPKKDQDFYN